MSRPAKPAPVQFYIDADVLGLAKVLVQIRGDVTYPGDPGGAAKGAGSERPAQSLTGQRATTCGFQRLLARGG